MQLSSLEEEEEEEDDTERVGSGITVAGLFPSFYVESTHVVAVAETERLVQVCVFIVHVGGTRCVPSSTDNIMNIHARITLTVEFIRTCICLFLFYV